MLCNTDRQFLPPSIIKLGRPCYHGMQTRRKMLKLLGTVPRSIQVGIYYASLLYSK